MSEKRDDGGGAFHQEYNHVVSGMSLRDYFAALVLEHCIRASEHDGHYDEVAAATAAYIYADAMLEARKQ